MKYLKEYINFDDFDDFESVHNVAWYLNYYETNPDRYFLVKIIKDKDKIDILIYRNISDVENDRVLAKEKYKYSDFIENDNFKECFVGMTHGSYDYFILIKKGEEINRDEIDNNTILLRDKFKKCNLEQSYSVFNFRIESVLK